MSEEKDKPVFDEQTLARLLEAAYVLQEHNRRLAEMELHVQAPEQPAEPEPVLALADWQAPRSHASSSQTSAPTSQAATSPAVPPKDDYTQTLAQIVETQHQIQVRHLELNQAMAMIAERTAEIARAHGAAIGMVEGKNVAYRAASGLMTLPAGAEVPMEKALCVASLRTGQVIRCTDVSTEFLLDAEECHRRGIQSLIAVPVYHDGGIAGAMELYYSAKQAFSEQEVHTCQLMAGLITEALARSEELTSKKSLAEERAAVLEALEKLKPNLAAMVDASAAQRDVPGSGSRFACRSCGHQLLGEEQFCGKCGQPRSSDYGPADLQSKVASLWHMQEAKKKSADARANGDLAHAEEAAPPAEQAQVRPLEMDESRGEASPEVKDFLEEMEGLLRTPEEPGAAFEAAEDAAEDTQKEDTQKTGSDDVSALSQDDRLPQEEALLPDRAEAWSSAAKARDFLEQLAEPQTTLGRLWKAHRGDISLAATVVLVACVIYWGAWSSHPVSATGSQPAAAAHRSPDADLSLFDRMLIKLGLADPPEPPENKGNPDVQVWVDLQTALYYCPGADLYGKTPKGKYASQRDAQLDAFEPALRKACN